MKQDGLVPGFDVGLEALEQAVEERDGGGSSCHVGGEGGGVGGRAGGGAGGGAGERVFFEERDGLG